MLSSRVCAAIAVVAMSGLAAGACPAQAGENVAPAVAAPGGAALLKAEYFARDPAMSPPQISPDGTHLAWIMDNQIVIHDLEDDNEATLDGGAAVLDSVSWVNNDYIVVYVKAAEEAKASYAQVYVYAPMIVSKEAKFVRQLFTHDGKDLSAADMAPIIRFVDAPDPYVITLGGNKTNITEIISGKTRAGPRLMDGDGHYFDREGRDRVSVEVRDAKISYGAISLMFRYKATPDGKAQTLVLPKQDNAYYTNFHYGEFDNSIYWSEFNFTTGVASIYRFDMATGQKTLFRDGTNKAMDVVFDEDGKVIGVTTVTDRLNTEWTDPYRLKLTGAVQKMYPDATVTIVDMAREAGENGSKDAVLLISAPEAPDSYYFYDSDSRELVQVGVNYPELEGRKLAAMSYMTYKARDGLDIPAYVTRRADTPAGAPLIVMPHGGPAARDVYGFDYIAQFLASRGYVVLQPEYRGSGGFGDAFERAGNKHLDLMTTDLEDGVRTLAAQGMIDPARVCVVGWSWGGYLAEASLAFAPDTYACGVAGAGVSDLFASLDQDNDYWWGGYGQDYWRTVIGLPLTDGRHIRAASPIEHVDAIKAPLLMIHSEADMTVRVSQSEKMNAAMKKAGKAVTYLPIKFMAHGPDDAAERLTVLKAIDQFVADAFAGKGKAAGGTGL